MKTDLRSLCLLSSYSEFSALTEKEKNIAKPHCLVLLLSGAIIALLFVN